jgi:hypothetical protein
VTYEPGRRWDGRAPVLRGEWREPLSAERDPWADDAVRPLSNRDERHQWREQSGLKRFVATYGWRAYALPILTVVTAVVLYQTLTGAKADAPADIDTVEAPPTIGSKGTSIIGAPPRGLTQFDVNLPTGVLPAGGRFTEAGNITWRIVAGEDPQVGRGTAKAFNYSVEIENGIDTTSYGGDEGFARMVSQTLGNPKSWIHNPQLAFVRVDASSQAEPDFRVSLTSPMTVRGGCGYEIELEASCYHPAFVPPAGGEPEPRVFINEARWVRGAVPFQGDVGSYRQYLINHEVGHAIGYQHHEPCDSNGGLAPVMMQQTFATANNDAAKFDPDWVQPDGKVCRFNPWPYPIA